MIQRALLGVIALLVAACIGLYVLYAGAQVDEAAAQAALSDFRRETSKAALAASESYRKKEQGLRDEFDSIKAKHEADRDAERVSARADADRLRKHADRMRRAAQAPTVAPEADQLGFVIEHLVRDAERYERLGSIASAVRDLESRYNECVEYGRAERVN